MSLVHRLRAAGPPAVRHLLWSLLAAAAAAYLVLRVWYPHPYAELIGVQGLLLWMLGVHLVGGALLTLVLYDPRKPRWKWRVDLALVVALQAGALAYGLFLAAATRPVFLAFEGNRFRVVQAVDVDRARLPDAVTGLQTLGLWGPRLIGVKMIDPTDPGFLASVNLSMQGLHPAFRPSRWVPWADQKDLLLSELKPLADLRHKHPDRRIELDGALPDGGQDAGRWAYLPLVQGETTDWVAVVDRSTLQPVAYLAMDGW